MALFNILAKTKKDAQNWLKHLSVGKDDYIDEYRQRIMELNEQRRDLDSNLLNVALMVLKLRKVIHADFNQILLLMHVFFIKIRSVIIDF